MGSNPTLSELLLSVPAFMHLLHTLAACRDFSKTLHARPAGNKPYQLALVPTMGALHEGHMALVSLAQQSAGQVVVSIFVNPTQFGPSEDLSRYPRPLEADLARCEAAGVNAVFLPDVTEMYPHGQAHDALTLVTPPANLTGFACGKSRPGHYSGVATVVLKLLNILQPELAVFGEKDAQQLAILRRMVADLNVPVTLLEHPVVRETEGPLQGVAMSSRNRYLTRSIEHEAARCLSATLNSVRSQSQTLDQQAAAPLLHTALENSLATLSPEAREVFQLDYLLAVDPERFSVQSVFCLPARLLIAACVGKTRLIDTLKID